MTEKEYLNNLNLPSDGEYGNDGFIVQLRDSDHYGKVFSTLEKSNDLDPIEDNQLITDEGSSLMYESESEPYLITLLADWNTENYQLVVNTIDGD